MSKLTPERIAEIRARLETLSGEPDFYHVTVELKGGSTAVMQREANSERFNKHAPDDIGDLLAALEAAEGRTRVTDEERAIVLNVGGWLQSEGPPPTKRMVQALLDLIDRLTGEKR